MMTPATLRSLRLRHHRLSAPARGVAAAASHMLATQAQEFSGGRWALAVRTRGAPTLSDVDAAFDRGELVRSWTMRGTLHIVPAADLAWLLSLTGERMLRHAEPRHRELGLDAADLARAERCLKAALAGGGSLTRAEAFAALAVDGVDPAGQRGYHVLFFLAARGVVCWGPVEHREGGPTREQRLVLTGDWIPGGELPGDPLAELFARYIQSHGPAGAADFAWWSGLTLGTARRAAEACGDRLERLEFDGEPLWSWPAPPRRSPAAPVVLALPAFDEFYLSYADRTRACAPEHLARIGPSSNGMVRPIVLARGEVAGLWRHSVAMGGHRDAPAAELFSPTLATAAEVGAALARYAAFIAG